MATETAETVVLHAVGATGACQQKTIGWRRGYRAGPDDIDACEDAVRRGWMVRHHLATKGTPAHYVVTDTGLAWASEKTGREVDPDA